MARILLQQEGVLVNATNDAGESALHWCHSADSVRLLVEHGADLEQCDKSGHTPLMKACSRVADKNPCRADVIFALLAAGASIHTGFKANAVSVCWDNIGNDIVETLLETQGYDLYAPSSTCSPLPWVNLSRDCGNPVITDLLKKLPRIGELCGGVVLARGLDGSKGILMKHARRFKAMQADSDHAEEFRQERLLEYVSPMIVQAQIALTRCKLWLVVSQSLPNPYDDSSMTRGDGRKVHAGQVMRRRRDAAARAEDCLDMSLNALEALLGPLKREAEALNMLATEKEGRGESCTYAKAIAGLIDSIQNEAENITHIAVRCASCLPVCAEGDEEAAASAAEEAVLAATVAILGYGCDWTSIIAGLRDVFRAADDEDVGNYGGTADITRLVKRLLKKCCTDFTTHPSFQQLKLNKKRVQLQKARNNVRDARAEMNDFLHSSEEKSTGQRLSGEQRRKQKIEHTNLVAGLQNSVEEVEKKVAKLGGKYLAAVRELPALWDNCETQVDEMLSRKAVHLFNKADRGKIDPENPAGCAGLGKAVCAFSALIASSAHRHATAVGQIYVDRCETEHTADVVDESELIAEAEAEAEAAASQLLDDLPVEGDEEKGTDGPGGAQKGEGGGKKKNKKNKKKNKKKKAPGSAAGGSEVAESVAAKVALEPSDPLAKEASEKSRRARQMKREQDAAEQQSLEEEWVAGEAVRVANEKLVSAQAAREAEDKAEDAARMEAEAAATIESSQSQSPTNGMAGTADAVLSLDGPNTNAEDAPSDSLAGVGSDDGFTGIDDPTTARICGLLKHAIDSPGPGQLALLMEATTAFGKEGINHTGANALMTEAIMAQMALLASPSKPPPPGLIASDQGGCGVGRVGGGGGGAGSPPGMSDGGGVGKDILAAGSAVARAADDVGTVGWVKGDYVDFLDVFPNPTAPNEEVRAWRKGEVSEIDGMRVMLHCVDEFTGGRPRDMWIDCCEHSDRIVPFGTSNDLEEKKAHDIRMTQEQFKTDMTGLGFRFYKCQGDGNCLFRAIAHQVHGDEEKHEDVRRKCCDYMLGNERAFSPMWGSIDAFKAYVKTRRNAVAGSSGEWGDDLEIRACEGANEWVDTELN